MPTVRSYFYRSLRLALNIGLAIIAALFVFFVICWILPAPISNGILLQVIGRSWLIIIFFTLAIFALLVYKGCKVKAKEKFFGQELLKMIPAIVIWLLAIGLGLAYTGKLFYDVDCQNYNYSEKLNGGVKEFNGNKYTINICGSGVNNSRFFGNGMDSVQLTITNEQGQIIAKRRYKILWEAQPGHEPLTIGKDSITYQDDETETEHTIVMPPAFLERVHAHMPSVLM